MALSAAMLSTLGVAAETKIPANAADPASQFATTVRDHLAISLPVRLPDRNWQVLCGASASTFSQYQHLNDLDRLVRLEPQLRVTLGTDFTSKPDVAVAINYEGTSPYLHAAISCKWTIRSDRVQSVRHEFSQMIKHRRGRLPHLVLLTAEPLPTRLASIARGTGEVDATYHIAFEELAVAVDQVGTPEQQDAWQECVEMQTVRPYRDLAPTLAAW